ncbi:MAG: hypothetical protein NUV34_03570 [Sulfuricaulis sp.]|nr:hypothetical protein [Sulfuricaulis sp.]
MAYSGSTAASSAAFPPILIAGGLGGGRSGSTTTPAGKNIWFFATTDTSTGPFVAGYFTDGYELGMKQGDVMIVVAQTSTVASSNTLYIGVVSSVSSTGGGTQLSTFSFISST